MLTLVALTLLVVILVLTPPGRATRAAEDSTAPVVGLGVNFNFPFLGVSVRYWVSKTLGLELNLAPIPQQEKTDQEESNNYLEIKASTRALYRLTNYGTANFYVSGGPALTLKLEPGESPTFQEKYIAILGEIELSDWPVSHLAPVLDYGYTVNLNNLYDLRWLSGGVGFHYQLE